MIKTYTKLLLTSLVLAPYLYADAPKAKKAPKPPAFETVWEKVYGGDDNDIARGVVMLEDGDSAVIGECKSYGASRNDICVIRFDKDGKTKWRKIIQGKKQDRGMAITRAKDGNLFILGSGKSFNENADRDLYVAKINLDGKTLWKRTFGGSRDEYAGGIAGTDDGGALIVGDSESFSRKGYKDIYILRLDK
ncbi:MAG TPA: hypothetical protein EYP02_07470, partial [Sulfurovum sp.]|nr:hypothetical protein [Sulfurovum sp.]